MSRGRFLSQLDELINGVAEHERGWRRVVAQVQSDFPNVASNLILELGYFYRLGKDRIASDFQRLFSAPPEPVYADSFYDVVAQLLRVRQALNKVADRKRRKFGDGREDIPLSKREVRNIRNAFYKK